MRMPVLLVALVLTASGLVAQETQQAELQRPKGWRTRFDRSGVTEADVEQFVSMPPGWHITTGRAAGIFYDPKMTASGSYRLRATIHLFDPGSRHREAYGVFFGGSDLQGDRQAYSYFLLRDTGEFIVKRRMGTNAPTVVPWTASAAIDTWPGEGTAKNELTVVCATETVEFYVNGDMVVSVPRSELDTDGVLGIRANHALNLHVETLEATQGR